MADIDFTESNNSPVVNFNSIIFFFKFHSTILHISIRYHLSLYVSLYLSLYDYSHPILKTKRGINNIKDSTSNFRNR